MEKTKNYLYIYVIAALAFFLFHVANAANEVPQTFTLDGQLTQKASTDPLLDSSAKIVVQILDPSKNCILYEEQQTVDTTNTAGYFSIQVGSSTGAVKRTANDAGRTMAQIFQNTTSIVGKDASGRTCPVDGGTGLPTYVPTAKDSRYFRLIVTPSSTNTADTLSPDVEMGSMPSSLVAQTFQGYVPTQFLFVGTGDLTQANLQSVFATGNAAKLNTLLATDPNLYIARDATSGLVQLPSGSGTPTGVAAGQMWYDGGTLKYYDGSAVKSLGVAGSGVTSITAGTGLTGGTISSSGTIAVDVGTTAGKIVQVAAGDKLPVISGANLTALNGSEVQSGTIGGTTAVNTSGNIQTSGSITAATGSVAALSSGQISIYDHATNSTNYITLKAPATGSLTADYSLTLPVDDGTNGQVMLTDGSGVLTWTTLSTANLSDGANLISAAQMPANCAAGQTLTFSSPTGTWTCSDVVVSGNNFSTQTMNTVLAGPASGADAKPTFRALAAADIPNLDAAKITTGTLAVANGGTGTATGSITGTGALTFAAGGANQNVTLTPSGTGYTVLNGSVGVGTATPGASALLDITSTTKGVLIPRMTTAERDAIASPATGLQIYNTTTNALNYHNGTSWQALGVAGSGVTSLTAGTGLTGGTITSSGTVAVDVGTTANKIVQLDGSAKLPAVDGSALTNLNAANIASGTLPIARGGTNSATALNNDRIMISNGGAIVESAAMTNGQLLVGSTGAAPTAATLTAGSGISITNGAGSITIATSGVGTLTAVTATAPLASSGGTTPDISIANQNANLVLAGPSSGGAAAPTFRSLASADIPNLDTAKITSGTLDAARLPALTGDVTTTVGTAATSIAANAVTTAKIADGAVTAVKLGSDVGVWSVSTGDVYRSSGSVGIGAAPVASALLDMTSTAKGVLIPRMTTAQRDAIASPATGLQIYNTTTNALNYHNGTSWQALGVAGSGISSITAGTGLTGGTITSSGTVAVDVGTTANKIVQLDGSAKLPAVDGSALTNLNAGNIASGTLPIARGGTNSATALNNDRIMISNGGAIVESAAMTNGQLLIGSTGAAPTAATLTAGTGITITNSAGGISIATSGAAPTGAAGGDLSGTYPNPAVAKLQGNAVASTTLVGGDAGKTYVWNGTSLTAQYFGIADLKKSDGTSQFSSASCAANQTLTWSSLTDLFVCANIGSLNASAITAGTLDAARLPALTGDVTTTVGTAATSIAANAVTTAKIADANVTTAKIADGAVTDAKITSVSVGKITNAAATYFNYKPANTACGDNEVLKYDSTLASGAGGWKCATDTAGTGTVTAVTATAPLASSGGTTPDISIANQNANLVLAGPSSGGAAAPTFRSLASADIPNLDAAKITTGTLAVANGGTGTATGSITGTGALTFAAGGANQNVRLTPSGTGYTVLDGSVGMGTATPAASSILEISSTTKGVLIPRMTTAERDAISSPATGLQVYNTTTNALNFYNGTSWQALGVAGSGVTSVVAGTGLTGGTITSTGTIAVDVGTTASKIVQLDGSAKLPAVDGSALTNLNAGNIASGTLPIARGGTNSATALNNNRIMVSSAGSIVEAGAMTNGQLLIGSTGAAPVVAALTAGTGITITNSAGGISIATSGAAPTGSAGGDLSGTYPNPAVAKLQGNAVSSTTLIAGDAGKMYVWDGTALTAKYVSIGDLKKSNGVGQFADANCAASQTITWSAVTDSFTCSNISGLDAAAISSGTIAAARMPAFTGDATSSAGSTALTLATVTVAKGGTGSTSLTSGSILVGNGTSALSTLAGGTTGNVIYATSASAWASGTPDTAGLVDKSSAQTITGAKTFTLMKGTAFSVANPAGTGIDFANGNTAYTSVVCAGATWTVSNMASGTMYMVAVQGTAHTGSCAFSDGSSTFKYQPTNATPTNGKDVIYSMIKIGTVVYVSWIDNW